MVHDRAMADDDDAYRGWVRPGPRPPGAVSVEDGETLDFLCGKWRIFQYARGHRYSTDDVLCAFYASTWAPRVARALDLGSGIGSIALMVAWRLPGAHVTTLEAQPASTRLARKSIAYNGVADRFTVLDGDLRSTALPDASFDLVTGSPPYWATTDALPAAHEQAIPARLEVRGTVDDYALAASRALAPGGVFVCVHQLSQHERVVRALDAAGLAVIRHRPAIFKEGVPESGAGLYLAMRAVDVPARAPFVEPPLYVRTADGRVHAEYAATRLSFGFPPGDVPSSNGSAP